MTNIERMAKEAGYEVDESAIRSPGYTSPDDRERLTKFAALVAESCAKECDNWILHSNCAECECYSDNAAAIRAKYPKEPG